MPKLERQTEPVNLDRLKAAVQARWGTVDLLDFLAEADHHVGLADCFPSVATREATEIYDTKQPGCQAVQLEDKVIYTWAEIRLL